LIGNALFELLVKLRYLLGSLAQFAQQPRVLDSNDRLAGEVLDQLNLFIGKWPYLLTIDDDGPD
jgi:hypothetical protein